MRVTLIHQHFKTPEEGGGIRSWHLAKAMADKGWEVCVIAAHSKPQKLVLPCHGFKICYLPVAYENRFRFWKRVAAFIKFMLLAFKASKELQAPNFYYLITTPLTVAALGPWLKLFRKTPYFVEVGDLWPDVPIQMGYIRNTLFKKYLYSLEKNIYQKAKGIISLSVDIESTIRKKCPNTPIITIPNFADNQFFKPEPIRNRKSDKFTVLYTGAMGIANGLESVLLLAKRAQSELPSLRFRFMGDGAERPRLVALAKDWQLSNVEFIPHQDKVSVLNLLDDADAILVSYAPYSKLGTGSPNKFFDGLAAGKPIILNAPGWMQQLIIDQNCGFYYPPQHPDRFFEQIRPLVSDTELRRNAALNARKLAERAFDKNHLLAKLLYFLEKETP
jgi:glycosyltransferase involved in cell wall biosynthesis